MISGEDSPVLLWVDGGAVDQLPAEADVLPQMDCFTLTTVTRAVTPPTFTPERETLRLMFRLVGAPDPRFLSDMTSESVHYYNMDVHGSVSCSCRYMKNVQRPTEQVSSTSRGIFKIISPYVIRSSGGLQSQFHDAAARPQLTSVNQAARVFSLLVCTHSPSHMIYLHRIYSHGFCFPAVSPHRPPSPPTVTPPPHHPPRLPQLLLASLSRSVLPRHSRLIRKNNGVALMNCKMAISTLMNHSGCHGDACCRSTVAAAILLGLS